jgi:hypothetical protein
VIGLGYNHSHGCQMRYLWRPTRTVVHSWVALQGGLFFQHKRQERMLLGLDLFERDLCPRDVADIRAWSRHPGLSSLLTKLQSMKRWQRFLDHYAEAMIALCLIRQACELQYEVPTVNGGSADFKVSRGGSVFFVHVKRTNLDQATRKNLDISRRLARLREIRRPITVSFMFCQLLTDQEMQRCCKEARAFIEGAAEGERKEIESTAGELLGEFEIGPRHNGQHVRLAEVLPAVDGGSDCAVRSQLGHAYRRFMPGFENVILVTDFWNDEGSIDDMRDAFDEFWAGRNHPLANAIVYFVMDPKNGKIGFEPFFRNCGIPSYIIDLFRTAH